MSRLKSLLVLQILFVMFLTNGKSQTSVNTNLHVGIVHQGANTIAQISYAGKQGHQGSVHIYNSQHQLIKYFSVELIGLPYSASMDVSSLQAGHTYTIELTTDEGQIESININL